MKKAIAFVAALAAISGSAMAQKPVEALTSAAFRSGEFGERTTTLLSTGFEAPGFATGSLEPQNGWSSSGTNLPWQQVSNANPFAGSQHLRMTFDASIGAGSQRLIFSPNLGAQPVQSTTTSLQVNISNDGGADYDVIGQAPSQGFATWRVRFSYSDQFGTGPGEIFVLDDNGEGALAFISTGTFWSKGSYKELKVVTNPATLTTDYYYGGSLFYSGTLFAGTTVEQLVFRTDNFQLGGETGDIDNINLTIVPAPGVLALAGLGGLAAARRRRA